MIPVCSILSHGLPSMRTWDLTPRHIRYRKHVFSSIPPKRLQNGERKIEKTAGDFQKDGSPKLGVVANIIPQQFLAIEVYDDSFFFFARTWRA